MFAAYDLSGVASSEERKEKLKKFKSKSKSKPKPLRPSKYLSVEDMTAVLASASEGAYPTLLQFTAVTGNSVHLCGGKGSNSHGSGRGCWELKDEDEPPSGCGPNTGRKTSVGRGSSRRRNDRNGGSVGRSEKASLSHQDPEVLAKLLQEIARKNAASYAERAVSEFGQSHNGALTKKEFEKWVMAGPVLRCRINEFSIDLNAAPFQGVRLA